MSEPTDIRVNQQWICLDCGRVAKQKELRSLGDPCVTPGACPRCESTNVTEYVESKHQNIAIWVPDQFEHPMEHVAMLLFERVSRLTKWREEKVRLWFQLVNPLLGNVSPEWMIMNNRHERLAKFIDDAEYFSTENRETK